MGGEAYFTLLTSVVRRRLSALEAHMLQAGSVRSRA